MVSYYKNLRDKVRDLVSVYPWLSQQPQLSSSWLQY